jgi:hypothetical protein
VLAAIRGEGRVDKFNQPYFGVGKRQAEYIKKFSSAAKCLIWQSSAKAQPLVRHTGVPL